MQPPVTLSLQLVTAAAAVGAALACGVVGAKIGGGEPLDARLGLVAVAALTLLLLG